MMGLSDGRKSFRIGLAGQKECAQTDRQTDTRRWPQDLATYGAQVTTTGEFKIKNLQGKRWVEITPREHFCRRCLHSERQWHRSVVIYGGQGQSGQAIKLFQITPYVDNFRTLNNPGSPQWTHWIQLFLLPTKLLPILNILICTAWSLWYSLLICCHTLSTAYTFFKNHQSLNFAMHHLISGIKFLSHSVSQRDRQTDRQTETERVLCLQYSFNKLM